MTTYIEAATAVATAVGGLIVALIVVLTRIHQAGQQTLAQVRNSHGTTNLRDDIDRIYDAITDIRQSLHETRAAIHQIEQRTHTTYRDITERLREIEQ